MTMTIAPLKILLVEDDEDDYVITRRLVAGFKYYTATLEWAEDYQSGLSALDRGQHDVYLIDYRLGDRDGIDLLRSARTAGCRNPIIFLTGQGHNEIDLLAMQAGASDFLIKGAITAATLERSIRYAVEHARTLEELENSHEKLRRLAAKVTLVREEERAAIARDVHDELGQALTGLKMDVAWLDRKFIEAGIESDSSLRQKLHSMSGAIDRTIGAVQRISSELRPSILDDLGIDAAIEWHVEEFTERMGIKCDYLSSLEDVVVSRPQATALFRILQESLTNIARHAQATRVDIILEENNGDLVLEISDNGRGITKDELADAKSLGLLGMKERAVSMGGNVTIEGVTGKGTTVRARVPLKIAVSEPVAFKEEEMP